MAEARLVILSHNIAPHTVGHRLRPSCPGGLTQVPYMTAMGAKKHHIQDARGSWVTQLDPIKLHLLRRHDVIPADALREIAEATDRKWARWGYWLVGFNGVLLLAVWVALTYYVTFQSPRGWGNPVIWAIYVAQLLLIGGGAWFTWVAGKQTWWPRVRLAMLKHARCPHCGYDLRGLTADAADDAVACPECGCAWLLNDPAVLAYDAKAAQALPPAERRRRIILTAVLLVVGVVFLVFGLIQYRRASALRVPAPTALPATTAPAAPASTAPAAETP